MKIKCYKKYGWWTVDNGNQMWDFKTPTEALKKVAELKGIEYK